MLRNLLYSRCADYNRKNVRSFAAENEIKLKSKYKNMFRKSVFILLLSLAAIVQTKAAPAERDSLLQSEILEDVTLLSPIEPSYLSGVTSGGGWGSNWFINVQGGASAFIGTPIGCADLFDRTMPVLQVNVGKWFTPAIGGRIAYQGLKFRTATSIPVSISSCMQTSS